jgi:hypothetical protein
MLEAPTETEKNLVESLAMRMEIPRETFANSTVVIWPLEFLTQLHNRLIYLEGYVKGLEARLAEILNHGN